MDAGVADPALAPDQSASWIGALVNALYLQAALHPQLDAAEQTQHLIRTVRAYLSPPAPNTSAP